MAAARPKSSPHARRRPGASPRRMTSLMERGGSAKGMRGSSPLRNELGVATSPTGSDGGGGGSEGKGAEAGVDRFAVLRGAIGLWTGKEVKRPMGWVDHEGAEDDAPNPWSTLDLPTIARVLAFLTPAEARICGATCVTFHGTAWTLRVETLMLRVPNEDLAACAHPPRPTFHGVDKMGPLKVLAGHPAQSASAASIAAVLATCTALTTLRLSGCGFNSRSAVSIARALAHHPGTLTHIDLSNNVIGPEGATALGGSLRDCSSLQDFEFTSNAGDGRGVAALCGGLAYCLNLQYLRLGSNKCEDEGATAVADSLGSWPRLRRLELGNNRICPGGASMLARGLLEAGAELRELDLSNQSMAWGADSTRALATTIGRISQLRSLDLTNGYCSNRGAMYLAAAGNALPLMTDLQVLRLGSNMLGPKGLQHLGPAFGEMRNLRELDVSENRMTDLGAKFLAPGLVLCPKVRAVDVSGNLLGAPGLRRIGRALVQLRRLKHLDVHDNPLGVPGATTLAGYLTSLTKLQTLNVACTALRNEGLRTLCEALPKCPSITALDVGSNLFNEEGAAVLAATFPLMAGLQVLVLSGNVVLDAGVRSIAVGMARCALLTHVDVAGCGLSPRGLLALAELLPACGTLVFLSVLQNKFKDGEFGRRILRRFRATIAEYNPGLSVI